MARDGSGLPPAWVHSAEIEPLRDDGRIYASKLALAGVEIVAPKVPLVANVRAEAVSDPAQIRAFLVEQVTGSVRWRESVLWLAGHGVTELVEIGAGKALSGMARRIDRALATSVVNTAADVKSLAEALAE